MYITEEAVRHQTIAAQCQHDARLAQHHHEQYRSDSSHGAESDEILHHRQPGSLERLDDGSVNVDFLIRHHSRQNRRDSDVEKDRKSTRLNSSHSSISYAVFCLKKKKNNRI